MICPYCKTEIPDKASNCPHCTKSLVFTNHPTISFIVLGVATAGFSVWTFWFPPLAIMFLVVGVFFILMGILMAFTKPLNKFVQNQKDKKIDK